MFISLVQSINLVVRKCELFGEIPMCVYTFPKTGGEFHENSDI